MPLVLVFSCVCVKALAACLLVCVLVCHECVFDRVSTCVAVGKPSNLCLSQSEKYNAVTHSQNGRAKAQSTLSIIEINSRHCNLRN